MTNTSFLSPPPPLPCKLRWLPGTGPPRHFAVHHHSGVPPTGARRADDLLQPVIDRRSLLLRFEAGGSHTLLQVMSSLTGQEESKPGGERVSFKSTKSARAWGWGGRWPSRRTPGAGALPAALRGSPLPPRESHRTRRHASCQGGSKGIFRVLALKRHIAARKKDVYIQIRRPGRQV